VSTEDKPPPARMPRQIPYIIASEGCERFSFYGMRNILTPFLVFTLLMYMPDEATRKAEAKDIFHSFVIGVYFFPLLGGWLADRFFGKFNTILVFSLIYCAGHAALAVSEFVSPDQRVNVFYAGLFLIALGAGGIKPLVASFVGDQFDSRNKHLAKIVFDAFYWIINFGSFFASLLMPMFLKKYGPAVAFGIPGALMFVATAVLWFGRRRYVLVPVAPKGPHSFMNVVRTALTASDPNKGNLGYYVAIVGVAAAITSVGLWPMGYLDVVPALCLGVVVLIAFGGVGTSMQLERARGKHPDASVDGVRSVLRLLILFLLVTPFHSLFDQKASEWVIQGQQMTLPGWTFDPTGETAFQPAQMQLFNPLLVMILIPFNNLVLYPAVRRMGFEPTALRRMTAGILFSAFAWVAAGCLQVVMDGGDSLHILWQILPYALLTFGEVLVSATGLEFAYSQAPHEMKGVIMSFWNLTTSIGNLWVLLVNAAIRNDSVTESIKATGVSETTFLMFFFAGFAGLATLAFWLYARRYRVADHYRVTEAPGKKDPLPTATAIEKPDKE
jgi:proton-dependent oligopeptide transporter, POT family